MHGICSVILIHWMCYLHDSDDHADLSYGHLLSRRNPSQILGKVSVYFTSFLFLVKKTGARRAWRPCSSSVICWNLIPHPIRSPASHRGPKGRPRPFALKSLWKTTTKYIYSGHSLKGHFAKGHLSNKDRIFYWQPVLWMPLLLPPTKGHLSTEDSIIWQNRCRY